MTETTAPDGTDAKSAVPDHIQRGIDRIATVHARHDQEATAAQRVLERAVSWLSRPLAIGLTTLLIGGWIGANIILAHSGTAFDPPPFVLLEGCATIAALYLTVLVLVTAQRQKLIGEHREQLMLQLAILSDQKSAKIIQLLEEARRDNPLVADRHDPAAEDLSHPADPEAVLDAIKDAGVADEITAPR